MKHIMLHQAAWNNSNVLDILEIMVNLLYGIIFLIIFFLLLDFDVCAWIGDEIFHIFWPETNFLKWLPVLLLPKKHQLLKLKLTIYWWYFQLIDVKLVFNVPVYYTCYDLKIYYIRNVWKNIFNITILCICRYYTYMCVYVHMIFSIKLGI